MKATSSYWNSFRVAFTSLSKGLRLTGLHMIRSRKRTGQNDISSSGYFNQQIGIATIEFPHVTLPVPDTGRYQLHNEIDDCIVCDKCAKICPVDCIDIESIRSPVEFGKTSDGTSKKIYAAKFDINMGKCCFCGLCTTVCPTECLTMTKTYDFSTFDIREHKFAFATMSAAEITEKRQAWEVFQQSKPKKPDAGLAE